jgi:hypothetical protein
LNLEKLLIFLPFSFRQKYVLGFTALADNWGKQKKGSPLRAFGTVTLSTTARSESFITTLITKPKIP